MNSIFTLRDTRNLLVTASKLQWVPIGFSMPAAEEDWLFIKAGKEVSLYELAGVEKKRGDEASLVLYFGFGRNGIVMRRRKEVIRFDHPGDCETVLQHILTQQRDLERIGTTRELVAFRTFLTGIIACALFVSWNIGTTRSAIPELIAGMIAVVTGIALLVRLMRKERDRVLYADSTY